MDDDERADLDLGVIESMTLAELNALASQNQQAGMRQAIMHLHTAREHLVQAAATLDWMCCTGSAREVRAADAGIQSILDPLER